MDTPAAPPRPRLLRRAFLVFNGAMGVWFLVSLADAVAQYAAAESDSVRTGTLVGTGLGLGALVALWAAGALLLGAVILIRSPR